MKDTQAGSIETGKVNKRRASKNEMNQEGRLKLRLETTFITWKRVDSCLMRIWFRRFGLNLDNRALNAGDLIAMK
jgi:hypothetical protein